MTSSYVPATLLGLAIGDALGAPFERFAPDDVHPDLAAWCGGYSELHHRWYRNGIEFRGGETTDDTGMAVELARSLLDQSGLSPADVSASYAAWFAANPRMAVLVGGTLRHALDRLRLGVPWGQSGRRVPVRERCGNGTAMRAAPLGVVYRRSGCQRAAGAADAAITHVHPDAAAASALVAHAVGAMVTCRENGNAAPTPQEFLRDAFEFSEDTRRAEPASSLHGRVACLCADVAPMAHPQSGWTLSLNAVRAVDFDGGAVGTVVGALACAAAGLEIGHGTRLDSNGGIAVFRAGVELAVRAGGDTDTRAAITGAILGALVGREGLPSGWVAGLSTDFVVHLDALDKGLYALGREMPYAPKMHVTVPL